MSLSAEIKSAVKSLPGVRDILSERDRLHSELVAHKRELAAVKRKLDELKSNFRFAPPGHFYSPIPSMEEIRRDQSSIFGPLPPSVPGIDLRESHQRRLLEDFLPFYSAMPFKPQKVDGLRYYFENPAFGYQDAIFLYCMIRYLKPRRIVEVGSGFSSCVTLDTNKLHFDNSISTTFIEPHTDLLLSLLHEEDKDNSKIVPCRLQDVSITEFESLAANDILFVDSTHVSKINSDVNRIFFDILPRLAPGVYIHFHDIFYPFEYPKEWVLEGRAWNEAYMLRAFLQYNKSFEIVLMNSYVRYAYESFLRDNMPLCLNSGASLWLRRVA